MTLEDNQAWLREGMARPSAGGLGDRRSRSRRKQFSVTGARRKVIETDRGIFPAGHIHSSAHAAVPWRQKAAVRFGREFLPAPTAACTAKRNLSPFKHATRRRIAPPCLRVRLCNGRSLAFPLGPELDGFAVRHESEMIRSIAKHHQSGERSAGEPANIDGSFCHKRWHGNGSNRRRRLFRRRKRQHSIRNARHRFLAHRPLPAWRQRARRRNSSRNPERSPWVRAAAGAFARVEGPFPPLIVGQPSAPKITSSSSISRPVATNPFCAYAWYSSQ